MQLTAAPLPALALSQAAAVSDAGVTHARAKTTKVDLDALAEANDAVLPDENWVEQPVKSVRPSCS